MKATTTISSIDSQRNNNSNIINGTNNTHDSSQLTEMPIEENYAEHPHPCPNFSPDANPKIMS